MGGVAAATNRLQDAGRVQDFKSYLAAERVAHLTQNPTSPNMRPSHYLSLFYNSMFLFSRNTSTVPPDRPEQHSEPPYLSNPYAGTPEDREYRSSFSMATATVKAYPSQGGLVYGAFTGAELDWLGLSRLEKSRPSHDPQQEDEFAFKMMQLGARWWKCQNFYDWRYQQAWKQAFPWPDSYPPIMHVAYPSSGGVWVYRQFSKDDILGFARIAMARDMDERSEALKRFGAVFYKDVEECPDIAKSLQEGIAIAREWEIKMQDLDTGFPPHLRDEEDNEA